MLQSVDGKSAVGSPQVDGSGLPLVMSDGIEARGHHQIRIPASRSSVAYTCHIELASCLVKSAKVDTHSSTVTVEFWPIRSSRTRNTAAFIRVCTVVAVCRRHFTRFFALHAHTAAVCCMQGHTVSPGTIVGSFDNINLAISGPIARIRKPQGRPCAAAIGCMEDVEDE